MSAVGVESLKKTAYAAAKNKQPILEVLQRQLALSFLTDRPLNILEVASGTGEHASLFLESIPTLAKYQPSEIDESMHESIGAWLEPFGDRVRPPLTLNMMDSSRSLEQLSGVFEEGSVDAIICINMIHISPFACTHGLFQVAERFPSTVISLFLYYFAFYVCWCCSAGRCHRMDLFLLMVRIESTERWSRATCNSMPAYRHVILNGEFVIWRLLKTLLELAIWS